MSKTATGLPFKSVKQIPVCEVDWSTPRHSSCFNSGSILFVPEFANTLPDTDNVILKRAEYPS
jgi:hypothetical protein